MNEPEQGEWVLAWGQVQANVPHHPEDVVLDMFSHNEQYSAHVRLDRIKQTSEKPPFAEDCHHLWKGSNGLYWRCTKTNNHSGKHKSNGGNLSWESKDTGGYVED